MAYLIKRQPILVTGSSGMLGFYFRGPRFWETRRANLDICDEKQIERAFQNQSFSLVLHLAAATHLEFCEQNPQQAWKTNVLGTENLAKICAQKNIPMIYISTSGIFSGSLKMAFAEDDLPCPTHVYAHTKYNGELAVKKHLKKYFIIRVGWLMGGFDRDHKFVGQINRKILQSSLPKLHLDIVSDTQGSLLYGKDLPTPLWQRVRKQCYGIHHITNSDVCSRLKIAQVLRDFWQTNSMPIEISPVSSKSMNLGVQRPRSEVLLNHSFPEMKFPVLRAWDCALKEYLEKWSKGMELGNICA